MNFNALFQAQIDTLKSEGNYRYFAELERKCGKFPHAASHHDGKVVNFLMRQVTTMARCKM